MKKVINITIGGIVFFIEEDAYHELDHYLSAIRKHFASSDDQEEIVTDIEISIAEKFSDRIPNLKTAVTLDIVGTVIEQMGTVSQIEGFEQQGDTSSYEPKKWSPPKRLYRDTDNVVIGGVASGIAAYFGIDPVIVRIIFLLTIFIGGFGVVIYIIMWIIVPPAETASQKLEMYGEPVTLKKIRDYAEDGIQSIKKKDNSKEQGKEGVAEEFLQMMRSLFTALGKVVKAIIPLFRIILGFVFFLVGFCVVVGLLAALSTIFVGVGSLWFLGAIAGGVVASILASSIWSGPIALAFFFVLAIPFISLLLASVSLLRGKNYNSIGLGIVMLLLWSMSLVFIATTFVTHAPEVRDTLHGVYDITHDRGVGEVIEYLDQKIDQRGL